MGALNNFISYAKKISEEQQVWQIALRKKNDIPLYNGNGEGFLPVPNSARYWRADPFVFKYKGTDYIFAEMFDRKTHKGVIGVAKIKKDKCTRFKVCLDLPYHLSYPCVFENKDGIFMIPECCGSNEITMYKSVRFPLKWEKYKTLQDRAAVDTTPIFDENNYPISYLSSAFDSQNCGNDNLYGFRDHEDHYPIYTANTRCRCAGHIIKGKKLIRPIQDDSGVYGNSMYFSKVSDSNIEHYSESIFIQVVPPGSTCGEGQVAVSLAENKKRLNYIGVHTYNSNEDYEVIDLLVEKQLNRMAFVKNRRKLLNKYLKKLKRQ